MSSVRRLVSLGGACGRTVLRSLGKLWWRAFSPDGLPLPPKRLRALVALNLDTPTFLANGKREKAMIERTLADADLLLSDFESILDFGCGCGRVLRHLSALEGAELYGSDYNRELVAWCSQNLPFASFSNNGLEPPLSYASGMFDFVWAFSVFTHLSEELQQPWMQELRRVLAPGGYLLFTVHGDSYGVELTGEDRRRYENDQLVVRAQELAGTNMCAAFHPEAYVRDTLAHGFDVLTLTRGGKLYHDVFLLRRSE